MGEERKFIPVAAPSLDGNERKYVLDCVESSWISSSGVYIDRFEREFAAFCGVKHATTCSNGTVALHLALLGVGIKPGDEVLVPTLTYIASVNAITYCGARPVFVDSTIDTWNIDPSLIEEKITERTKAIIVVHLYGCPVDMNPIMALAETYGLFVIEDAAEAHGARYGGLAVGSIGHVAAFSFYGNKIITTGEGGMVTTNNDELAAKMRILHGQGMDPKRRYWFPVVGYNYRMSNVAAAIGVAQLERVDCNLERRQEVAMWYRENLREHVDRLSWQVEPELCTSVTWIFTVALQEDSAEYRDEVTSRLQRWGIETRPVFFPIHSLPPYVEVAGHERFPIAESIARRGINLPTWVGLSRDDVQYVCKRLLEAMS